MKMNRCLNFLFILIAIPYLSLGQATTAQDFTKDDCDGTSHHLFDELDNGNIIMIEYVMNCGLCLSAAYYLDAINNDYAVSNPDIVKFYVMDWQTAFTCTSLDDFMAGLSCTNFLDGYDDVVYYGGMGMPTIVVLAGTDHHVYYSKLGFAEGTDDATIRNAIDEALAATSAVENIGEMFPVTASPNPASSFTNISYSLKNRGDVEMNLLNILGESIQTIQLFNQSPGENIYTFNTGELKAGIYFINLRSGDEHQSVKLVIYD